MAKSRVITSSVVLEEFVDDAGGKILERAATRMSRGLKELVRKQALQMGFSEPRAAKLSEQLAASLGSEVQIRVWHELGAIQKQGKRR